MNNETPHQKRKEYSRPQLRVYGDVPTLTRATAAMGNADNATTGHMNLSA